jgi:lactoylglutathione lyase
MSSRLTSITLNTALLDEMLQFYRLIGFNFVDTAVDKGGKVFRATMEGLEFTLLSIPLAEKKQSPGMQFSFAIENLEEVAKQLAKIPQAMLMMEPTEMPDGKKAILMDPEGRAIELSEIKKRN